MLFIDSRLSDGKLSPWELLERTRLKLAMIYPLQLESMLQENETLKEKMEELSLELEILRSEVSDGGNKYIPFFFLYSASNFNV